MTFPSPAMTSFAQTIDGMEVRGDNSFLVVNPSTGQPFARCPAAAREDLDRAVEAARRAFEGWSNAGAASRRAALHRFADAVEREHRELAAILTTEQGKPLSKAQDEVLRSAAQMRRFSSIELACDRFIDADGIPVEVHYRPLGVVGAITPWNMPVAMAMSKISHALYTGNTLVLKPSPYTPLSSLWLGSLGKDIFPAGVLNVLAGEDDLGRWMTEHPHIAKITFTGSVNTGKRVMASAAATLKRITLELGGNDAAIVLKDVDPVAVAPRIFAAAFANSGQVCMAIKRLYVEKPVFEPLCQELARLADDARIGDGFSPGVELGPIQNAMQFEIVQRVLAETMRDPQATVLGGRQTLPTGGYFMAPRIVMNPAESSSIVAEETFGPLLPVMSFDDVDAVVRKANDTRFGLSGSIWTGDMPRARELAARLEVGTAWINHHLRGDAFVPFGGSKESGLGRENSLIGLRHYMEPQVVLERTL